MKFSKKILVVFMAILLILSLGMTSVFAQTYFEYDHFRFFKSGENRVTISKYDNDSSNVIVPESFFGDTVEAIEKGAFNRNNVIESIKLPSCLESIGDFCFAYCKKLTSIEVPALCSKLGVGAFQKITCLTSIDLGNSITDIPQQLLYGCTSLKKVIVPDSVTKIDYLGFSDCDNLEYVYVPESVTEIDSMAFDGSTKVTLYGKTGSYAEQFAKENNIPFVSVSPKYELGDVNLDGVINITDVTKIQFYVSFGTGITEEGLKVADVNNDGVINIGDATLVQKMIALLV